MKPGPYTRPPPIHESPRGPSSRELLKMDWEHPVHAEAEQPAPGTTYVKMRRALSRAEALAAIAGEDPRPLLVLRECQVCNKTDDALLKPGSADNERTLLYSKWFRCVKLPVDVIDPSHPFNALFPDNDAEHLFVSLADGSGKLPLESDTSRIALWTAMESVLRQAYVEDPAAALKQIARQLDRQDVLERRLTDAEAQLGELMESPRADKARVQKARAAVEQAREEVAAQKAAIAKLRQLEPRPRPAVAREAAR